MVKTTTTSVARKPIQRALEDWRTICAARSGLSEVLCVLGGAVKRSAGATSIGGRGTGSDRSGAPDPDPDPPLPPAGVPAGSRPGWSVIDVLGMGRWLRSSARLLQASGGRLR